MDVRRDTAHRPQHLRLRLLLLQKLVLGAGDQYARVRDLALLLLVLLADLAPGKAGSLTPKVQTQQAQKPKVQPNA